MLQCPSQCSASHTALEEHAMRNDTQFESLNSRG